MNFTADLIGRYLNDFDYESAVFYAQYFYDTDPSLFSLSTLARCLLSKGDFEQAYVLLDKKFISGFRPRGFHPSLSLEESDGASLDLRPEFRSILSPSELYCEPSPHEFETSLESALAQKAPCSPSSQLPPPALSLPNQAEASNADSPPCDPRSSSSQRRGIRTTFLKRENENRQDRDRREVKRETKVKKAGKIQFRGPAAKVSAEKKSRQQKSPQRKSTDSFGQVVEEWKDLVYYFGVCCAKLERYAEGIAAFSRLRETAGAPSGNSEAASRRKADHRDVFGSREYHQLGILYMKCDGNENAFECFEKSLVMDSKRWASMQGLGAMGKQSCTTVLKGRVGLLPSFGQAKNEDILENASRLAKAQSLLDTFKQSEACALLKSLSTKFTWARAKLAVLQCDLANYEASKESFDALAKAAPHSISGMDIYSTVLWQLGERAELSFLAQELAANFKKTPQFWVVMANAFSMHKQHRKAIYCLQKSVKIEKSYAYGYNVLANEHLAVNETDLAEKNFLACLEFEPCCYKALNGLGIIAMKRSNFELASQYYKRALSFNSGNHVLVSHLAVAESKRGFYKEALELLNSIKCESPLVEFQRADVLFKMGELNKAERILLRLEDFNSGEASVSSLLGEIYKAKNQDKKAFNCFKTAIFSGDNETRSKLEEAVDSFVENSPRGLLF